MARLLHRSAIYKYMHIGALIFMVPCIPLFIHAQNVGVSNTSKTYRNELVITTENDNYVFLRRDGYYTNGLYISLNHAVDIEKSKCYHHKPGIKKVVNTYEIGQAIYNPVSYNRPLPYQQDRPFAGYLSGTFGQRIFYKNNRMLQWAASVGVIGPSAGGENVQRWYHRIIGIYDVKGWPYQVHNEPNLNIKIAYYASFLQAEPQQSRFNIDGFASATLGNANTNLSAGLTFKMGLVENVYNSSHLKASVGIPNNSKHMHPYELYVFYEPMVTLQVYNAVLQGGLFVTDKGPVTVPIKPMVLLQQLGVRFAKKRFTAALIYNNRTRQATTQQRNENFGSIQISILR